MEKIPKSSFDWFTPSGIALYFEERLATKGHDQGRKMFMCEFLKSILQCIVGDDIFILGKCSAQTKKSVDYEINIHLNCKERSIVKASCKCPAGIGPNGACKHVGAVLYGIDYYAITGM